MASAKDAPLAPEGPRVKRVAAEAVRRGTSFASGSFLQQRLEDQAGLQQRTAIDLGTSWRERAEALNDVKYQIGPIITLEQAPQLYAALSPAFERLATHQEERSIGVAVGELIIVDNPDPTVFTKVVRNDGVDTTLSMVFISTGMLKRFYEMHAGHETSAEAVRATMLACLGAAAHGLGTGVIASEDRRKDDDALQADSLRADAEGVIILRDAGLPPQAMLRYIDDRAQLTRLYKARGGDGLRNFAKEALAPEAGFAVRRAAIGLTAC